MKCNNCGMEWSGPAAFTSKINACPFCGASLQPAKPQFSSMDEVLSYTVGTFGVEIMRDGVKLQSFFADLAPHLKKEKIMLRHFIECDGHIVLLQAVREEPQEAQAQINSVIQRMEDDLMVMPEVASPCAIRSGLQSEAIKGRLKMLLLQSLQQPLQQLRKIPELLPLFNHKQRFKAKKPMSLGAVLKRHIGNGYKRKVLPPKSRF